MNEFSTLVNAIQDCGYWRWWSESFPELFQIEFGGVQIYVPLDDPSVRPSGLLALRFLKPSRVHFIRRSESAEIPPDWPERLKAEQLEPSGISFNEFAICDDHFSAEILSQSTSRISHYANDSGGAEVKLAFWAGSVGIEVWAAELRVVLMTGEITLANLETVHGAWWPYWKDYWKKKDTDEALPYDETCEVTIPIKSE